MNAIKMDRKSKIGETRQESIKANSKGDKKRHFRKKGKRRISSQFSSHLISYVSWNWRDHFLFLLYLFIFYFDSYFDPIPRYVYVDCWYLFR